MLEVKLPKLVNVGGSVNIHPMSTLAEIEAAVLNLQPVDRARFVEWLDQNRRELLPSESGNAVEITEAQRREVLRRRDELLANPALARPLDGDYFTHLRQKVADVRAKETPAG